MVYSSFNLNLKFYLILCLFHLIFLLKSKKRKGRLSNGSGFIVDDILVCEYVTHNKRLSYLKINKLIIIGCYFPYQGGQTPELRADNENEYYQTIADLNILLESLEDGVHELIVLGDFNTDFNKHISRCSDLLDMCVNHSLTSADINKTQSSFIIIYGII